MIAAGCTPSVGRLSRGAGTPSPALTKWLADAVRIDSIAQTIPTDSIRALWRALATSEHPGPLLQAQDCVSYRISWHYGTVAAEKTLDAAQIETYRELGPALARRLETVLGEARVVSTGPCGNLGRPAPKQLGGTPLYEVAPRPKR